MTFDFDRIIDRRNTNCTKWDNMEKLYGVSPSGGISMWVADMDFASPPAVNQTLHNMADHGVHGYFGNDAPYLQSIRHWMASRHGWEIQTDWISTVHGLVSGIGLALQAFTRQRDAVIVFSPVYHAFHRVVKANKRKLVQSHLVEEDGRYRMDLDALANNLTGKERVVILCSPHNPGGRVWSREELRALADFCKDHDLILFSDEVHHDLIYPGHTHHVMHSVARDIEDRLVMFTAASKTFGLAGALTGNVIIPDAALRTKFEQVARASGTHADRLGAMLTTAAYAHGSEWLDALIPYLDRNRQIFDDAVNALPGIRSMPLEATFLSWVDFSGTGMTPAEFTARVQDTARIAANHGDTFGEGGETFLRFNIATRRAIVEDAAERLAEAFADLQ